MRYSHTGNGDISGIILSELSAPDAYVDDENKRFIGIFWGWSQTVYIYHAEFYTTTKLWPDLSYTTSAPTRSPTNQPSNALTAITGSLLGTPSIAPTKLPSRAQTKLPTLTPSSFPTQSPIQEGERVVVSYSLFAMFCFFRY